MFIKDFWIYLCTLKHWKTSNTDFCSHPGNLKYYNTFIKDFWIYLCTLKHLKTSKTDFCSHPGNLSILQDFLTSSHPPISQIPTLTINIFLIWDSSGGSTSYQELHNPPISTLSTYILNMLLTMQSSRRLDFLTVVV